MDRISEAVWGMIAQAVLVEDINVVLKRQILARQTCQHCGVVGCQPRVNLELGHPSFDRPRDDSQSNVSFMGKGKSTDVGSTTSVVEATCPMCSKRLAASRFVQHLEQKCSPASTANPSAANNPSVVVSDTGKSSPMAPNARKRRGKQ